MPSHSYDQAFFEKLEGSSRSSAEVVVPHLIACLEPRSVVDVGCGSGEWAKECGRHGLQVLAIDGYGSVADPVVAFRSVNLESEPLPTDRQFELVLCLEVAEHLSPERGARLVEELCGLGPAVAFSAAIPGQGGTNHVNERWQSHWARHFERLGFVRHDCIRPRVWDDERVARWYRQNLIVYSEPSVRTCGNHSGWPTDVVHPEMFSAAVRQRDHVKGVRALAKRARRRVRVLGGAP